MLRERKRFAKRNSTHWLFMLITIQWDQMRLSSKFRQISQYWIAVGIFIESRAGPRMHTVTICPFTLYMNLHRACYQDIRYRKDRYRSFIFQSYGVLWIWRFALWIKNDCSIFAEKKSLLDFMYGDSDKEIRTTITWDVCCERAGKTDKGYNFCQRETAIKNSRASRKKLIALNVKFLQSLGFVVRNIWDDWYLEYWRW